MTTYARILIFLKSQVKRKHRNKDGLTDGACKPNVSQEASTEEHTLKKDANETNEQQCILCLLPDILSADIFF